MKKNNLGIISIATNRYLEYWKDQVNSIEEYFDENTKVSVFLFTDQVQEAVTFSKTLDKVLVKVVEIPSYVWPDATLLRYQVMNSNFTLFSDQDVLLYLDADMKVTAFVNTELFFRNSTQGMTLVRHPGFYRENGFGRVLLYFQNPITFFIDLWTSLSTGGLGGWETNPKSQAFVRRVDRKNYYCGGIWWGGRKHFQGLVNDLAKRVENDSSKGFVAKWHDESHLNQWASKNNFSEMLPSLCFVESYPWLSKLEPLIIAVEKTDVSR